MDKGVMSVRMKKWAGILQEANASGLTKTEWCERNGINRRQFFHWQKRIREFVLEQNPDLGLSIVSGGMRDLRAINSQITSSLPVFCELKPTNELSAGVCSADDVSFSAGAMIHFGEYKVHVADSISENVLSMILAVIRHA